MKSLILCLAIATLFVGCASLESRLSSPDPSVRAEALASVPNNSSREIRNIIGNYIVANGSITPRFPSDVRIAAYKKYKYASYSELEWFFPNDVWSYKLKCKNKSSRCAADAKLAIASGNQEAAEDLLRYYYSYPSVYKHIDRNLLWDGLNDPQRKCNVAATLLYFVIEKEFFPSKIDAEIIKSLSDAKNVAYAGQALKDKYHEYYSKDESKWGAMSRKDLLLRLFWADKGRGGTHAEFMANCVKLLRHPYFEMQSIAIEFTKGLSRLEGKSSGFTAERNFIRFFAKYVLPTMDDAEVKALGDELSTCTMNDATATMLVSLDWNNCPKSAKLLIDSMDDERLGAFLVGDALKVMSNEVWTNCASKLSASNFKTEVDMGKFFSRLDSLVPRTEGLPLKSSFALSCLLSKNQCVEKFRERLLNLLDDEQLEELALKSDFNAEAISKIKSHERIFNIMLRIKDLRERSVKFNDVISLAKGEKREYLAECKRTIDQTIKKIEAEKAAKLEEERRLAKERERKLEEERKRREAEEDSAYEKELANIAGKTLIINGYFLGMNANVARRKLLRELGHADDVVARTSGGRVHEFRFSKDDLQTLLKYGDLYPDEWVQRFVNEFHVPEMTTRIVEEDCSKYFSAARELGVSCYDVGYDERICQKTYTYASENGWRVTYYGRISYFGKTNFNGKELIDIAERGARARAWSGGNAMSEGMAFGAKKKFLCNLCDACENFLETKGAAIGTLVLKEL